MTTIIIFMIGSILGSFLLVLAERVPQGQAFVFSRSKCAHCSHTLRALDLIPVFSYLFLKGTCRYCGHSFSYVSMISELLCGWLLLFFYHHYTFQLDTLWLLGLLMMNLSLSFTDLYYRIVEPKILYPVSILCGVLYFQTNPFTFRTLIPPFIIFVSFYIFQLFFPDKIGGGDIKLLMVWSIFFSATFLAKIILVACSAALIYIFFTGPSSYKQAIPFVPFLTIGFIFTIFF